MFSQSEERFHQQYSQHEGSGSLLKNVRQGFIRKVFSIVAVQLALTALMIYLTQTNKTFNHFQSHNQGLMILSTVILIICSLLLGFSESFSKKVPLNYITLGVFTLCEAYSVSAYTISYDKFIVLKAAFLTAGATLSLLIYAATTKKDITTYNSILFIGLSGMMVVSLINFFYRSEFLMMLIEYAGVVAYSFYLIYDIQIIMDNYIHGAMFLYVDIVQLFIKILRILGEKQDDDDNKNKKNKKK